MKMSNPFYKLTKKDFAKGVFFNFFLAFLVMVMIKLTPESIGIDWSWWIITAPIWIPVVLFLIFYLFVWMSFVIWEINVHDDEPYGKD